MLRKRLNAGFGVFLLFCAWVSAAGSRGDMNGDGKVNLADPVYLLGYLFAGSEKPVPCEKCWYGELPRGDVNRDTKTNIADAVFLLMYLFSGGEDPGACPSCYPCRPCLLPATGAKKCGANRRGKSAEVPCDDPEWPGQDGYYQKGCPPEGRFVDNGDGTVTDLCTGLMWQRDTPMPPLLYEPDNYGRVTWEMALSYCENLELAGYDDWRLPNYLELATLVDDWTGKPNEVFLADVFHDRAGPLPSIGAWTYWSSTGSIGSRDVLPGWFNTPRYVGFSSLGGGCCGNTEPHFVRAVRGGLGDPCASCLPATGFTTCVNSDLEEVPCDDPDWLGQDAYYQAGRPFEGRFYDNGDGTITDLATGLMWVRDVPTPGPEYEPDRKGRVQWQDALKYCDRLVFAGYDDWRLPNAVELLSLMAAPSGSYWYPEFPPFNLKRGGYWSSTIRDVESCFVYGVDLFGNFGTNCWNEFYVLPVRDAW